MKTSTYSRAGHPVSSGEALVACGTRCRIVGSDSCALPGQVAKLVVVGYSTTSSVDCHSVAADVFLVSSISVLRFGESRGLVVFVVGIDLLDVLKASPVPVCWSGEYCRHSVIVGGSNKVFARASRQ
jgi:hypothetical protein